MSPDPVAVTTVAGAVVAGIGGLSIVAKSMLEKVLGPSAEELGEQLRTRLRGRLSDNRDAVVNRAAEMIAASALEPHEVPLRTIAGLLDGASLEEHPDLRERWAALLANASTASDPDQVPPVFATILANLTPAAALALEALKETTPRRGESLGGWLQEMGGTSAVSLQAELGFGPLGPRSADASGAGEWNARIDRANELADILVREGLASKSVVLAETGETNRGGTPGVKLGGVDIRITQLGLQFLRACTAPDRIAAIND